MVRIDNGIYVFIGEDPFSKDAQLGRIKKEFLNKETEQFNTDTFSARETKLANLQEKLLFLPFKSDKRIVVIRHAQLLDKSIQEFIISYASKPHTNNLLILDIDRFEAKDKFIRQVITGAKVFRFRQEDRVDTFNLVRQIDSKHPGYALRTLGLLLDKGEKPERILGGLRYSWENYRGPLKDRRRKLKLLLDCDIEMKTGKLKAQFALEKLVVKLCAFGDTLH
ncbi:MAG: hypothetical protein C4533_00660 [Candidatus Omnitrophota bacterium]|jgi:DNA polymerase III delta subunit|nr:MAG: hypothetical protein C4533_00660 [Candidatus Omnitrophota bacterium]